MSAIKLVTSKLSPFGHRVEMCLIEKKISYEKVDVDLADKPDWFIQDSPLGKAPIIYGNGRPLFESIAICEYLEEVKRRIMTGAYVLSHGYYDAYYLQAQKIRRMIADDFQRAFDECDVIAGPVAPTVAWKLGNNASDPLADYLADIFTLPASLAGLPCMSVPVGFGESKMPVGMQLIGNYLQEARLLNVAHQFQLVTDFHNAKPEGV